MKIYTKKNGETKYYSTYQSAWNAAIKLNEKLDATEMGFWEFEGDINGWYLQFVSNEKAGA